MQRTRTRVPINQVGVERERESRNKEYRWGLLSWNFGVCPSKKAKDGPHISV